MNYQLRRRANCILRMGSEIPKILPADVEKGISVADTRREGIAALKHRAARPLPAFHQLPDHSVRVREPPLSRPEWQNVIVPQREDAGTVKVGRSVIHLVIVLIGGVAELPVVQGFGPGVAEQEGAILREALGQFSLERIVARAHTGAGIGNSLGDSKLIE